MAFYFQDPMRQIYFHKVGTLLVIQDSLTFSSKNGVFTGKHVQKWRNSSPAAV